MSLQEMPSLYPSTAWRAKDDYSLPLYVTPTKAQWYHRKGKKVVFETRFDNDPAARLAKLEAEAREGRKTNLDFQKIATVPMSVFHQSKVEKWDTKDWWKWANNPDNRAFRVWRGRI